MGKNKTIESLFRERFQQFELEPSPSLWKGIRQNLFWKEFLQFGLTHLNVYYLALLVATLAVTALLLVSDRSMPETRDIGQSPLTETVSEPDERINVTPEKVERRKDEKAQPVRQRGSLKEKSLTGRETAKSESQSGAISTGGMADRSPGETGLPEKKVATPLAPVAVYSPSTVEGCLPLTVQFTNLSENAGYCLWMFGDGGTSKENHPTYIYDEPGSYPVTLKVFNDEGESVSVSDTVHVYGLPEAVFEIFPENPDIPAEPVNFYNYSRNASRFMWDFGDNTSSREAEPVHFYKQAGTYDIRLTVWSVDGCTDTAEIRDAFAGEECSLVFPNAFTPNPGGPGEGYYNPSAVSNEIFYPVCKGVVEYHLRIFSRSGALVFESDDVNVGWDGYINGSLSRQDVYVWKVRGRFSNGKTFVRFGNVTLIRK